MPEALRVSNKVIVRFPDERVQRAARGGATLLDVWRGRVRQSVGRFLNFIGAPGAIQPAEFQDNLTGQHIAVLVDESFVRFSVSGRDYFFDRITGRFDGTGAAP